MEGAGTLEVLISETAIRARVTELAAEITRDYAGRDVVLVCLLKGAVIFASDLARAIRLPVRLEFVRAASYGAGRVSSGEVRIEETDGIDRAALASAVAGGEVLVVEDIVDSGRTLGRILSHVQDLGARSAEVCTLLYKDRNVDHPFGVRYIGFRIEDRFVVGYGLDFAERYRNLPYVAVLEDRDLPGV
ncbi:MAG: hypoxanthine phosphoribosyltransferase [Gemmatimonadetes bacterium]|nr:hypoxanthine phosphoribosyltransferase [Gemmatimonadota bacterium]